MSGHFSVENGVKNDVSMHANCAKHEASVVFAKRCEADKVPKEEAEMTMLVPKHPFCFHFTVIYVPGLCHSSEICVWEKMNNTACQR